jgi:hypothetical protein
MNESVPLPRVAANATPSNAASTANLSFTNRWAGLTWEIAAIWYIILVLACVSALSVFDAVRHAELDNVRRARLSLFLSELREKVETDLRLGFDLREDRGAQATMDELIRRDSTLRSIEIFDATGQSRASTDRGTVGEAVSQEWMRAMGASSDALWTWSSDDEIVLGVPLKGGFGEVAGHIAVTYAPLEPMAQADSSIHNRGQLALLAVLLLVFFLPFLVTAQYVRSVEQQELLLKGDATAGPDADTRDWAEAGHILTRTRQRLDSVMQQLDKSQ